MSNSTAILLGALLIALAIFFRPEGQRFQIAKATLADGSIAAVWRLDARTGQLDLCGPTTNPFDRLTNRTYPQGECADRVIPLPWWIRLAR
jgi:hypothetical protein